MRLVPLAVLLLAACAPTHGPSDEALSAALGVERDTLRQIRCERVPEDPTEFVCRYRQKTAAGWTRLETVVAAEGERWVLLDTPAAPG